MWSSNVLLTTGGSMTENSNASPVFTKTSIAAVAHILAMSLEFILYGVYASLFVTSIGILRRNKVDSESGRVFFYSSLILFGASTFHICLSFPRICKAFVIDPAGPVAWLNNTDNWENLAHFILFSVMIYLGDALVIYRCFIIWARNRSIVFIPVVLLLGSIGINVTILFAFKNPAAVPTNTTFHLLDVFYPLNFVQNTLTTGLITLRLYKQARGDGSKTTLNTREAVLEAVKIIIESAAVYTIELFLIIILNALRSPFILVILYAVIPTIGIVFNLIAVRIYLAQAHTEHAGPSPSRKSQPFILRSLGLVGNSLMNTNEEDDSFLETDNSTFSYQMRRRREVTNTGDQPSSRSPHEIKD